MLDLTGLTELVAQRGLDSSLKAAGSDLSGGQKQRIELARALLQERQVLLVDEGTSALDPKLSELIHQKAIATFDGTVIEIAHKLSPKEQSLFTKTLALNELNKAWLKMPHSIKTVGHFLFDHTFNTKVITDQWWFFTVKEHVAFLDL